MVTTTRLELKTPVGFTVEDELKAVEWLGVGAIGQVSGAGSVLTANKNLQTLTLLLSVTAKDLTALQVEGRLEPGGDWLLLASQASDFSGGNPVVARSAVHTTATGAFVDTDATTVDAGQSLLLVLNTQTLSEARVRVSAGEGDVAGVSGRALGYDVPLSAGVTLSVGDIDLGNVGVLNGADARINPATLEAVQAVGTPLQRDPGDSATGSVVVNEQPDDGDTVTISDGAVEVVFEFDSDEDPGDVGEGNTRVVIGQNANQTAGNLSDAVGASALALTATNSPANTVALTNESVGTVGNEAITSTTGEGVLTLTGMSGGRDAVTSAVLGDRLTSILAALGSPAQAGEVAAAIPDPATQTTLAAVLADTTAMLAALGLGVAQESGGNLDALASTDFATETTLAAATSALALESGGNLAALVEAMGVLGTVGGKLSEIESDLYNGDGSAIEALWMIHTALDGGYGTAAEWLEILDARLNAAIGTDEFNGGLWYGGYGVAEALGNAETDGGLWYGGMGAAGLLNEIDLALYYGFGGTLDGIYDALVSGSTADEDSWAALTAPGSTSSVSGYGMLRHALQITVASINTDVVVRFEGSFDGTNWFNMDSADLTITLNGTYHIQSEKLAKQVRGTFVSETGGTAATVTFKYYGLR